MGISLVGSKIILALCNCLLLACGFTLVTGGMLILFDTERVLLSRLLSNDGPLSNLPHPLFYYVAIGMSLMGIILAAAGIVGCWASCLHNYYVLSCYFMIVMIILIGECAIYLVAWMWPQCMGLGLETDTLTKSLQMNYGTSGNEKFTNAFDLVQTRFHCCAVDSANEYDTSLWRLQSVTDPPLSVPLSCCKLSNINETKAYLYPMPTDTNLCQALEPSRHEGYRHTIGCKYLLEQWYREHYIIFLAVGLVVVLVEFVVLLVTILTCTRIYHHNQESKAKKSDRANMSDEIIFPKNASTSTVGHGAAYSNETYAMTDSYNRQNYRIVDRV